MSFFVTICDNQINASMLNMFLLFLSISKSYSKENKLFFFVVVEMDFHRIFDLR